MEFKKLMPLVTVVALSSLAASTSLAQTQLGSDPEAGVSAEDIIWQSVITSLHPYSKQKKVLLNISLNGTTYLSNTFSTITKQVPDSLSTPELSMDPYNLETSASFVTRPTEPAECYVEIETEQILLSKLVLTYSYECQTRQISKFDESGEATVINAGNGASVVNLTAPTTFTLSETSDIKLSYSVTDYPDAK